MQSTAVNSLSAEAVLQWLQNCAATYEQHKDELTELDAAIGDADHGANMARGFSAVRSKLADFKGKDIGTVFKGVAMTLISTVGGASGPLYGTFFLMASAGANGKTSLTHDELAAVFGAGLQGLKNRGKASVGEKTMVDALEPAIDALKNIGEDSVSAAVDRAVAAAHRGADSTVPLVAKKGRASYLGERSAGHMDPGAASTVLLFEALQQAIHSSP
jgi:dihydroxyacetone kinase-like protein